MFTFIKRAIQACQAHQAKEAASPGSPDCCQMQPVTELLLSVEEMWEAVKRARQQELADARAAAASGEGPQTWDRDWIEQKEVYIGDKISEIASTIGWHRTQDFLEVLDWALASPQGQRALAQAGDDSSPWQGALEMIEELRQSLIEASHQMLGSQADDLGYTIDAREELWEALSEVPGPLQNIPRTES
jgi:hypothetical protein